MPLPVNRTVANTAAEHVADHNEVHGIVNGKGVANGLASLDANTKVPIDQIPGQPLGNTFSVATQAAMLALAAVKGDMAIRTDFEPDQFYILTSNSPSTLADWKLVSLPGTVASVNGRVGAVTGLQEFIPSGTYVGYITGLALNNTDAAGNATKIADAIAAAPIGSTLHLPNGYIAATSIVNNRKIRLEGVGYWNIVNDVFGNAQWASTANFGGTVLMLTATTGVALDLAGANAGTLAKLMVVGPGTGTSTGLRIGSATAGPTGKEIIDDVLVANFSKSCDFRFCQECRFSGLSSFGSSGDLLHVADSFTNNEFHMTALQSGSGQALRYEGSCNQFNGLLVQACTGAGILCPVGFDQLLIDELWMENNVRGGLTGKAIDLSGTGHRINGAKFSSTFDSNIRIACNSGTFIDFIGENPVSPGAYTNTGLNNVFINATINSTLNNTGSTNATILPDPVAKSAIGSQTHIDMTAVVQSPVGNWVAQMGGSLFMQYNSTGALNDAATFKFQLPVAGTYTIEMFVERGADSAIATVSIDGTSVGTVDLYAAAAGPARLSITGVVIGAGTHDFKMAALSKNASSSSYLMRLSRATLTRSV